MTPKQIAYWAIGFKVMWVVALTQAAEHAWISALAVWGYTVLCGSRQPKFIWKVVVAGVFCSLIGDGTLGWLGVVQNPDGTALGIPPLWLMGLWCAFATLLPICFRWLYQFSCDAYHSYDLIFSSTCHSPRTGRWYFLAHSSVRTACHLVASSCRSICSSLQHPEDC